MTTLANGIEETKSKTKTTFLATVSTTRFWFIHSAKTKWKKHELSHTSIASFGTVSLWSLLEHYHKRGNLVLKFETARAIQSKVVQKVQRYLAPKQENVNQVAKWIEVIETERPGFVRTRDFKSFSTNIQNKLETAEIRQVLSEMSAWCDDPELDECVDTLGNTYPNLASILQLLKAEQLSDEKQEANAQQGIIRVDGLDCFLFAR